MRSRLFRVVEKLKREDYHALRPLTQMLEELAEDGSPLVIEFLLETFRG